MIDPMRVDESRAATIGRFRSAAVARGIPADAVESYLRSARPSLALSEGGSGPVVAVLGGNPPLPDGMPGSDEAFVALIDCAALPAGSTELGLPAEGHLLFFADAEPRGELLSDAVRYVPGGTRFSPEVPVDPGDEETNRRVDLTFCSLEWSWPYGDRQESWPVAELESAWASVSPRPPARAGFHLGGHPFAPLNDDPFALAQEACGEPLAAGDEWVLLACWPAGENCPQLEWGLFHWLIRRSDLAVGRFDRVYLYVDL